MMMPAAALFGLTCCRFRNDRSVLCAAMTAVAAVHNYVYCNGTLQYIVIQSSVSFAASMT